MTKQDYLIFLERMVPGLRLGQAFQNIRRRFVHLPNGTELIFDVLLALVTLVEAARQSTDSEIQQVPSERLTAALLVPACGWAYSNWCERFPEECDLRVLGELAKFCRDPYQLGMPMYEVTSADVAYFPAPEPDHNLVMGWRDGKIVFRSE